MVVKKYFKCHIGKALLIVDFFITVMTFVAFGPTTGLFSMVGLVIRSFAVDFFLEEMNTYKSFTIITDKPEQIYNFITITLHRGATVYHAEGLYEHTDKTVILTAQNKKTGNSFAGSHQAGGPARLCVDYQHQRSHWKRIPRR